MSNAHNEYPRGETLGDGRFKFTELQAGSPTNGMWSGIELTPPHREVTILLRTSTSFSEVQLEKLEEVVPGTPKLLFTGGLDSDEPAKRNKHWVRFATVHEAIVGTPLLNADRLSQAEAVTLGINLCQMNMAWAQVAELGCGLRPGTVYINGHKGEREFVGATPHAWWIAGSLRSLFIDEWYVSPFEEFDGIHLPAEEAVFTVALVLWYALLKEFAFDAEYHMKDWECWTRRPFTGPREIGRLLEAVLVQDVEKRMKVDEFLGELTTLATNWNVAIPAFPPLGLNSMTNTKPWRFDPLLADKFHDSHPDDLQVLVHDGEPRRSERPPERCWVSIVSAAPGPARPVPDGEGHEPTVYTGVLLNQPHGLTSVREGQQVKFYADAVDPVMVTDQYLQERAAWQIQQCESCGRRECLDPPSVMARTRFPDFDGSMMAFTAHCAMCGHSRILQQV